MTILYRFNNRFARINGRYAGSAGVVPPVDPYNPLNLPPYTIRCKFAGNYTPSTRYTTTNVQVSSSPNIWDITYESSIWTDMFEDNTNLLEIMGANVSNVTELHGLCSRCYNLTSVALFDNSSNTNMSWMFQECTSLTSIPLFPTDSVTEMYRTFANCFNVYSGALALYQQASSQASPPSSHSECFSNCGTNTIIGTEELAQIPSDWGGNY